MYFTVYHTRQDRNNKRFILGEVFRGFNAIGGALIGKGGSSEGSSESSAEDPVSSSEGVTSSVTQEAITAVRGSGRSNMEERFIEKDVANGVLTREEEADAIARKILGKQ